MARSSGSTLALASGVWSSCRSLGLRAAAAASTRRRARAPGHARTSSAGAARGRSPLGGAAARARGRAALARAAVLTCTVWLGCGGMLSEPAPQVETAALHDARGDAVIATLHTRDSELRVLSSGGSVRYSLVGADGESQSLTLDELQSYDPDLFEVVQKAIARRGPALDATRLDASNSEQPAAERATPERSEAERHTPVIPAPR